MALDDLAEFQRELKSLSKENYERLKTEIIETGFAFPFHVWRSEKNYIIGGHQRKRTLQALREEGYEIPPVPVDYVDAPTYEIAKRRVLQDISQYGKVERQGLYEFMADANIPMENLAASFDIPEFQMDMDRFKSEFFENKSDGEESDEDELNLKQVNKLIQCPNCREVFAPSGKETEKKK